MKLYNSLTKQVEELRPLKNGEVGLYTCGPTVYDHAHIGNLRTYIFEDTLRRVLKLEGYKVKHVMNITDVDDKTIARAKMEFPDDSPSSGLKQLTAKYERIFTEDAKKVGIDFSGSKIVRATEHIKDMQALIASIPNKYTVADGVYFEINKFPEYGVFTKLDHHHAHHRIANDEYDKEHVADFALWKAKKADEPAWAFAIDGKNQQGRPGWHIECSAMSAKYLGQPFDIHTGGVDLKFPHHENEIAQSKSASGKDLANLFVYGEHLLVEGRKMSKKLNNFLTLANIEEKGFDPMAFRLLVLQAHYRSQLNFTWESLAAAQNFLHTLYAMADKQFQPSAQATGVDLNGWFKSGRDKLSAFLKTDLNTAKAVAWLAELADFIETTPIDTKHLSSLKDFLHYLDDVFGLGLGHRQDISAQHQQLIHQREAARTAKDFAKADKLRKDLAKQGIGLNDNPYGVTWFRLP